MPRLALIVAAWATAWAIAALWAWQAKVGPIMVSLSDRHGIHLGDVVGLLVASAWAIVATLALAPDRSDRRR